MRRSSFSLTLLHGVLQSLRGRYTRQCADLSQNGHGGSRGGQTLTRDWALAMGKSQGGPGRTALGKRLGRT